LNNAIAALYTTLGIVNEQGYSGFHSLFIGLVLCVGNGAVFFLNQLIGNFFG